MNTRGSSPRGRGKRLSGAQRAGSCLAHPRAGGENLYGKLAASLTGGSSPRGRGKLPTRIRDVSDFGLIPARAGKTNDAGRSGHRSAAHPRAGGENRIGWGPLRGREGSSPRGRGKPDVIATTSVDVRLIPARAGKTRPGKSSGAWPPAHPRAGGENNAQSVAAATGKDSSPRGRGKRDRRHCRPGRNRLIPARAGKTTRRARSGTHQQAHPRAGGENCEEVQGAVGQRGSSPRGRGKPCIRHRRAGRQRLIPARAGKTKGRLPYAAVRQAHPRAGGENASIDAKAAELGGSSPRGRGKPASSSSPVGTLGLIPARAGKTPSLDTPYYAG